MYDRPIQALFLRASAGGNHPVRPAAINQPAAPARIQAKDEFLQSPAQISEF